MREKRVRLDVRSVSATAVVLAAVVGLTTVLLSTVAIGSAEANQAVAGVTRHVVPVVPADRNPTARIVGGTDANAGWQVALAAGPGTFVEDTYCGGSLVSPDVVLTAAHCVLDDDGQLKSKIQQHGLRVLSGSSRLSGSGGELRSATEIWTWPGYDPKTLVWDIAVLTLSSPTSLGTPIQIAGSAEGALWTEGRPVWASGWGGLGNGAYPDHLQGVWLTVIGNGLCGRAWNGAFEWDTQFCAGAPPNGGQGICDGDSGGPLVAATATDIARLVGVTSFGLARKCGTSIPDGFARVAAEPLRSAIQGLVAQIRPGVSVVGSGTSLPRTIDRFDAYANAGIYVRSDCYKDRRCVRVKVRWCQSTGPQSFNCSVSEHLRSRGRFTATRTIAIRDNQTSVSRTPVTRWKVSWGWN